MSDIKVGSEWANHKGTKFKVLFVGGASALCQWANGREFNAPFGHFGDIYEPVPIRRIVWLNVYSGCCLSYSSKEDADKNKALGLMFQQEVELIGPREGEKG